MQRASSHRRSLHASIIDKRHHRFLSLKPNAPNYSNSANGQTVTRAFGHSITDAPGTLTMGSEPLIMFPANLTTTIFLPAFPP